MTETNMTFEEALRKSEELLLFFSSSSSSSSSELDAELQKQLNELLSGLASSRAFFVTFLAGDNTLADDVPDFILESIKRSSAHAELLSKNLVMSTAMRITHKRDGDELNAQGSERVARRTTQLIQRLHSSPLRSKLLEMKSSLQSRSGEFAEFIKRWNYDDEQCLAASKAIESALS